MPRPNEPRAIYSEAGLARRIAYERQRLDMSLDGLAKRMSDVGCPIHASAIYKIEKGDPPRRITVDELVAFATVFGLPISELLLPPEAVLTAEIKARFESWLAKWQEAARLADAAVQANDEQWAAHQALMALVEGTEGATAKRYFLELVEASGLRATPAELDELAKVERAAEQAIHRADKALRRSDATEKGRSKRG